MTFGTSCVVLVVLAFTAFAQGQDYPNLPQGNVTAVTTELKTDSLVPLFNAATGFVDIVYTPFETVQGFIEQLLTADDLIGTLNEIWQPMLQSQAGAIACLFFGILFIVVVLFGGIITCCCRCCCNKCGGEKKQLGKRSRSKWKVCFSVSLLICSSLIFAPGVIVLQSNQWINTVVSDISLQSSNIMQNGINYIDSINLQLDTVIEQYTVMSDTITSRYQNLSNEIGNPIKSEINDLQQPALSTIQLLGSYTEDLKQVMTEYETNRQLLVFNYTVYTDDLSEYRRSSLNDLSEAGCVGDTECLELLTIISNMNVSELFNFSTLADGSVDLTFFNNYSTNCYSPVLYTLPTSVPTSVSNLVNAAITPLITSTTADVNTNLAYTETTINSSLNSMKVFSEMRKYLADSQATIRDFLGTYSYNYDQYRWIAGIVLGTLIIFVSACFFIGIVFGQCCIPAGTNPTKRGCLGNIGGIFLMSGAGLSLMFSWLLMILVTITFLTGGITERYICQTTEPPYKLLQFVDSNIGQNFSTSDTIVESRLTSILISCENNAPITTAFGLSHLVNTTEITEQLTSDLNGISISLTITPDSSTQIYSSALQTCLAELEQWTPHTNITLPRSAALPDFTSEIASMKALVRGVPTAYTTKANIIVNNLEAIQNNIDLSVTNFINLQMAANTFTSLHPEVWDLANDLTTSAPAADAQVVNNSQTIATSAIADFKKVIVNDATNYLNWFSQQVDTNLGACLPIFTMYNGLFAVICDYLVDSLNGFWFALGWSIFFMIPSTIIAMKLAKFYRIMDKTDPPPPKPNGVQIGASGAAVYQPPAYPMKSKKNLIPKSNKVAPTN